MNSLHLTLTLTSAGHSHAQLKDMLVGATTEEMTIHGMKLSPERFAQSPNRIGIDSKRLATTLEFDDHWAFLLNRLPALNPSSPFAEDVIARLEIQGSFDEHRPRIEISASTLQSMAAYGLEVGYDIYDLCE